MTSNYTHYRTGQTPLTLDEHRAIGALTWRMDTELSLITNTIGPAYGAKMCDMASKARRALDAARVALLFKFEDEYPPQAHDTPYDWPVGHEQAYANARATVRQRAAIIIEPTIEYVPPARFVDGRGHRLAGPLTFREHLVIGNMLYQARQDLMDLFVNKLQYAYGKTHTICERTRRTVAKIEKLRCKLDGFVCCEHPLSAEEVDGVPVTHAYYSPSGRERLNPPLVRREFLRMREMA